METKHRPYKYKYLQPPKPRSRFPFNLLILLGAVLLLGGVVMSVQQWMVEANPPPDINASGRAARPAAGQPAPQPAPQPPTYLSMPAIGVQAPVEKMGWTTTTQNGKTKSDWDIPANAAGWAINSAVPGQGSNIVLAGHNNIDGDVFLHLADLQAGDTVTLYVGNTPSTYQVVERHLIREAGVPLEQQLANAKWMDPTRNEQVTLISCWPPTNNTYRIIVIARLVD